MFVGKGLKCILKTKEVYTFVFSSSLFTKKQEPSSSSSSEQTRQYCNKNPEIMSVGLRGSIRNPYTVELLSSTISTMLSPDVIVVEVPETTFNFKIKQDTCTTCMLIDLKPVIEE